MEITKEEHNILLDALVKELEKPMLDPVHEITVRMLMKQSGKSERVCRLALEGKVNNEGWIKHEVLNERGYPTMAYYEPKERKMK